MCRKIAKDFNEAMWRLNGKKTECDRCKRHKKCYREGRLLAFIISTDFAKVSDYDNNGAHAMRKIDKKCPKKENKKSK